MSRVGTLRPPAANAVVCGFTDRRARRHPLSVTRRGWIPLVITSGLIAGCDPFSKPPPPAAAPPAEVTVARPLTREVEDDLTYTGTTTALASVEIRSRVTGFLEKVQFSPRDKVKKDAPLFMIDRRTFKANLDVAKAEVESKKAELTKAEFDAEKVAELVKTGAASPDEAVATVARRDSIRAAISALEASAQRAQLDYDWCEVVAPIGGRISRNLVDVGNLVAADTTVLATIVDDDAIYAYFNPGERDVLEFRERRRRELLAAGKTIADEPTRDAPVFLGLMTETGYPHQGVVDYVAPKLDEATGTLQVRARFENPDGRLLAGGFVRIRVPTSKPYPALVVTERALGSDQGQRYLLAVNDKNIVEFKPVEVGTLKDGLRVIRAGITANERVIVNGMQRVRPGATVKPIDAEMPVAPRTAAAQPASAPARPQSH